MITNRGLVCYTSLKFAPSFPVELTFGKNKDSVAAADRQPTLKAGGSHEGNRDCRICRVLTWVCLGEML